MKLADILTRDRVVPDLLAVEKADVLRELVHRGFLAAGQTSGLDSDDEERLVQVLQNREKLGSTGIKDGLAIPHGKVPGLQHLTACLGIHRQGVDFGALDGEKSHIFLVLMSPEQCGGDHLKALARISRLFSGGHLQRKLLESTDREALFDELTTEDARL
jgi:PTS system nitrogen regulatory IIA component